MQLTLSRSEIVNSRFNTAANRVPAELPAELLAASHVMVRWDGHVPLLAPLYNGPYAVLGAGSVIPDGSRTGPFYTAGAGAGLDD